MVPGHPSLPGADSSPELLGERNRLRLEFSDDGARLSRTQCGAPLPLPPGSTTDDIKKKVVRAIAALPTNKKVTTTFNHTRAPGPARSSQVTYLLPRAEPAGKLVAIVATVPCLPSVPLCCQCPP